MKKVYMLLCLRLVVFETCSFAQTCPSFSLGPDTTAACGSNLTLQAPAGWLNYLWNTGSQTSSINVSVSGNYWCTVTDTLANIIVNGDFSAGTTGFSSDYVPGISGPSGPLSSEGTYATTTDANLVHNGFSSCFDHTTGSTPMLVVNGDPNPGMRVWYQTVSVQPNTDYIFSAWFSSVVAISPAILQFSIDSAVLGAPFTLSSTTCLWQNFSSPWNSGNHTSVVISIVNQNTVMDGNDFSIDDILFTPVCKRSDTLHVLIPVSPVADYTFYPVCFNRFMFNPQVSPNDTTVSIDWELGDSSTILHTDTSIIEHAYQTTGDYTVTMVVTSQEGCKDSVSKTIHVSDSITVKVPNILVPGSLVHNDVVNLNTLNPGIDLCLDYLYTVFDRWGVLVFEHHNDPSHVDLSCDQCFRGKTSDGASLTPGVYFYILKGDLGILKSGTITLFE